MNQTVKSANGTPKIAAGDSTIRWEPSLRWVRVEFNGLWLTVNGRFSSGPKAT